MAAGSERLGELTELLRGVSPDAVSEVLRYAEQVAAQDHALAAQDRADQLWAHQVGPSLAQPDVARLLGKSPQAVHKDRNLLRLRTRRGRPVYPVVQFSGHTVVPGIDQVLGVLRPALTDATIAYWLTAGQAPLDGRRPIDLLRAGEVAPVLAAARALAASAA